MQPTICSPSTCPALYYAPFPSSFGAHHCHHLSSKTSRFAPSFWLSYIYSLFLEGFSPALLMVDSFITFRAQLKCHLLLPNHTICTLFFFQHRSYPRFDYFLTSSSSVSPTRLRAPRAGWIVFCMTALSPQRLAQRLAHGKCSVN